MHPPLHRPRRLRRTEGLRGLVRGTDPAPAKWLLPMFVAEGLDRPQAIASMPGVARHGISSAVELAAAAQEAGVGGVLLFGLPRAKDAEGSSGWDPEGIVPQAVRAIKASVPDLVIATDVCLCEYTDHGHCGVLAHDGSVRNDPTVERLVKVALAHAGAGADIVAPSDMMDGRIGAIRSALDAKGQEDIVLLSYAVKYASAFYGPFREAADSAPAFGDRRGYQMDPGGDARAARTEARLDLAEGADILMVKPAMAYLDILSGLRACIDAPLAAYHVSGEYAMVKAAAANGWINERRVVLETLAGIHRAGADIVATYHAIDAARWLREG
ncbi:MAG: porphobilinogen synthase [Armatimonadota bacterium]